MVNNSCLSKRSTRSITFLWSKFRVCVLFETNKVVYHGYVESIWSVLLIHLRNSLCTRKVNVTFATRTLLRELSFSTPLTSKLRVSRKKLSYKIPENFWNTHWFDMFLYCFWSLCQGKQLQYKVLELLSRWVLLVHSC